VRECREHGARSQQAIEQRQAHVLGSLDALPAVVRLLVIVESTMDRDTEKEQWHCCGHEQGPEDAPPGPARKEQPLQPHEIQ
jgi:hypothetical protein